jgi:deoxyadenosine/deoxycytidine kinase
VIGVGKTTFSRMLGRHLGALVKAEPVDDRWLERYYEDPVRWAAEFQNRMLLERFFAHQEAQWHVLGGGWAVIDRPIHGDEAFAEVQFELGFLDALQFETYVRAARGMSMLFGVPAVAVKLEVSAAAALRRIEARSREDEGRTCESKVTSDYLEKLDARIDHVLATLEQRGCHVIRLAWDRDRRGSELEAVVGEVAAQLRAHKPPAGMDAAHCRIIAQA